MWCLLSLLVVAVAADDPTILRSTQLERLMPFIGNGFVATHPIVGSEGGILSAYNGSQVFMSGVYNGVSKPKSEWGIDSYQSHRAAISDWVTNVTAGNWSIKLENYSLDMQRAFIKKSWTAHNETLRVTELHLAHQTRRNLLLHIVNATNYGTLKAALTLAQYPGSSCGAEFDEGSCPRPDVNLLEVGCAQHRCMNGSILDQETPSSPLLVVAMASTLAEPTIWLAPGETKTVVLARAFSSTLDGGANPLTVAVSALQDALTYDAETLVSEHVAGWADLWESGLEVEGDDDLAAAINGSLYNILSSLRADWPYGSSPAGLASGGYHGHVFWDQETWMWPPLNHLHPPIAAAMLDYRVARKGTAEANARSYDLPGLQYPWESTQTGVPADTWQEFGPEGYSCETYEIHIGGDIAQAFWRYWASTGDNHWLCSGGNAGERPIDMLRGIALYYSARVSPDPSANGQYELLSVTGPDEQAPEVDNSCYVSSIASLTMLAAANLSSVCGLPAPSNWTTIPKALKVPFNESGHFHPEFSGYPYGQEVKQADTIMAFGYPLSEWRAALAPEEIDKISEQNDLIYYDKVTNPGGPAMTWALFAMGWLDIGDRDRALSLFRRGYANAQPPFQVWTEDSYGGGCISFLTGAGGFLQSVMNGYLGVRLGAESLILRPVPTPGNATALALRGLHWHGRRLKLRANAKGDATVEVLSGASVLLQCANMADVKLSVGDAPHVARAPVSCQLFDLNTQSGAYMYAV